MIVTQRTHLQRRAGRRSGFTLMEVMVVAAILVILAGVGSIALFSYLETAREKAAAITIHKIEEAASDYKVNHGQFPENLQVLAQREGTKPAKLEETDLLDPWGNPWVYEPQTLSLTGRPRISVANPPSGTPIANW